MDFGLPAGELLLLVGALLSAGFVTGILAGLLGIGGGGIMVPVLYEVFRSVGVDEAVCIHLTVGTGLAVIIPTSLRSFLSHRARGAVDLELIKSMLLPVVAGVCVGAVVARYSDHTVLKGIWAGCATFMSLKLFFGRASWRLGEIEIVPPEAVEGDQDQRLLGRLGDRPRRVRGAAESDRQEQRKGEA